MSHSKPTVNERLTEENARLKRVIAGLHKNEVITRARVDRLESELARVLFTLDLDPVTDPEDVAEQHGEPEEFKPEALEIGVDK